MPFVTFTSKQPTSVTCVASGRLLGADDDVFVVLNRLTLISLYRVSVDSEGHDRLEFVKDFPIHGSLKYVRCVSIFHPTTHRLVRDLLFFCNIKQEVALVALSVNKEHSFVLETVFLNTVGAFCARQQHPGEVALCVSSTPSSLSFLDTSGSAADLHTGVEKGGLTAAGLGPFVAFGLSRGEVFLFDVVTALGSYLLRCSSERCREISDLVTEEVVTLAKSQSGKNLYLTPLMLDFTEFDVRDIVLVCEERDQALLVLYADQHGKKHVSQYRLRLTDPSLGAAAFFSNEGTLTQLPVGPPTVPGATGSGVPVCAGVNRLGVRTAGNTAVERVVLQSNVDPSASRLCHVERGIFVVGSQLISLISYAHGRKSSTTTKELQGATFYVEAAALCLRDKNTVCVAYNNGELLQVSAVTIAVSEQGGRRDANNKDVCGAAVHTARVHGAALQTVPDDMVAVGRTSVIITSRFADTYLLDLATAREEVILSNCGPVIDMSVLEDGPRTSVVASTGVAEHASLSLVRSAVSLNMDLMVPFPRRVVSVLGAGSLLILQGTCFNTYLRFEGGRFSEFSPTWSPLDRFVLLSALYLEEHEAEQNPGGDTECEGEGGGSDRARQGKPRPRDSCHDHRYHDDYIVVHERGYVVLRDEDVSNRSGQGGRLVLHAQVEVPTLVVHSAHLSHGGRVSSGDGGDSGSVALVTDGCIYFNRNHMQRLVWKVTCPVSCIVWLSGEEVMYGEWNQHVVVLNLRAQRIVSRISLPSVAHSLAVVPAAAGAWTRWISSSPSSQEMTIFVGLVDGSLVELSSAAARGLAYVCVRHSYVLMHRPVELRALGNSNCLICLGENPLVIIPQPNASFDITGFSLASVQSCGTLWCHSDGVNKVTVKGAGTPCRGSMLNFFFSQKENRLYTGTPSGITKTSHIPTYVKHTVTLITYMPNWNGFVFVARQKQCDMLQFFPTASLENTCSGSTFAVDTRFSHFLDNERCVFIEPLVLGGLNTEDLHKSTVASAFDDDYVVLVGSSFTFPDEQTSRSGRISWYRLCTNTNANTTMAASRGGRTLECVGDTDIEGPLLSCCIVPSYKGRIALGICGCVFLYNYNAIDRTFVPEEKCRIGVTLTKLLPVFSAPGGTKRDGGEATMIESTIIALDARCSAIVVKVDAMQGTLKVMGRDARLRGVVDGVSMDDNGTLCCSDDSLNVYFMEYESRQRRRSAAGAPHTADGDDEVADGGDDKKGECRRLAVVDEYHLGDLITTMRTGSFAPISLGTGEKKEGILPNTFARNIVGSQVVFGTAYGAFGSMTQINMVAYIFLKALEEALASSGYVNAVYSHKGFRSPLCIGQELDALSNRSFGKPQRHQHVLNFGVMRSVPNRFCDGDRVKEFLGLTERQREDVLQATEMILVNRLYAYVTGKPPAKMATTVPKEKGRDESNVPSASAQEAKEILKTCNKHLGECALPNIPLKVQDVVGCVTEIKKNF